MNRLIYCSPSGRSPSGARRHALGSSRLLAASLAAVLCLGPSPFAAAGWLSKALGRDRDDSQPLRVSDTSSVPQLDGRPLITPAANRSVPGLRAVSRVGSGAKKVVSKTANVLTFGMFKKKPERRHPWGESSVQRKPKKEEKPSWFKSWFGGDEPQKPETVSDWLRQDRIAY